MQAEAALAPNSYRGNSHGWAWNCWKAWKGGTVTLTGKGDQRNTRRKQREMYSVVNICVGETRGKHAAAIGSGKKLRLRNHLRAIDHVARVLAENSELGHGIPKVVHHPILIVDV